MASRVVSSVDFDQLVEFGLLFPNQFRYRFLVEGDSWMDRSSPTKPSLLESLAPEFDARREDVLFINLSHFGDTMRRIRDCMGQEFKLWLKTRFNNWQFDAILLSVGGNDFIDAARDTPPGQGILKNLAGQPVPPSGHDCVRRNAVAALVNEWLDPSFRDLYDLVQGSQYADIPMFLNSYDTPTARNAPASPGGRTWLFEAYQKNSIPQPLWDDLTGSIFNDIATTVAGWTMGRPNVHLVPTVGTLTPSAAGSVGSNADWLNEIHPNRQGWGKLSAVWRDAIKPKLPN
jgi:hypothetical protein